MGASKQRKPEKEVSLADDELLDDILSDLHNDVSYFKHLSPFLKQFTCHLSILYFIFMIV